MLCDANGQPGLDLLLEAGGLTYRIHLTVLFQVCLHQSGFDSTFRSGLVYSALVYKALCFFLVRSFKD